MATIQIAADWQKQWFEIADATYLNTAAHAAIPRVALHAVQTSIEVNKAPLHIDDAVFFEAPSRIRASLSTDVLVGKPQEKWSAQSTQATCSISNLYGWRVWMTSLLTETHSPSQTGVNFSFGLAMNCENTPTRG